MFNKTQRIDTEMQKDMNVNQLIGFLSSWSAYNTFLSKHPDKPDPLMQFKQDFMSAAQLSSDDERFAVAFPIFLLLCSNTA